MGMNVEVLSWNIWYESQIDKVHEQLKKSNADIIGLQEVSQSPDGKNNVGQKIASELGYSYVYKTAMDLRPYGTPLVMGNAVLSKYPIEGSKSYILSKTDSRVAVQANIRIKDTILHVLSTHLVHTHQKPSLIQEEQAKTLIASLPKNHTVVMGDFNATPESNAVIIMEKNFQRPKGDVNSPTWSMYPEGCKVCLPQTLNTRLDYFFVTSDIRATNFRVVQSTASDHLPISMTIEV